MFWERPAKEQDIEFTLVITDEDGGPSVQVLLALDVKLNAHDRTAQVLHRARGGPLGDRDPSDGTQGERRYDAVGRTCEKQHVARENARVEAAALEESPEQRENHDEAEDARGDGGEKAVHRARAGGGVVVLV